MGSQHIPLAERMRPKRIEDMIGQSHLLGPNGVLSRFVAHGRLPSMIFWGAPGTGKTTLARILASETKHEFLEFSGSTSSVVEVRKAIDQYRKEALFRSTPLVIFLDEIHRFNKAQQDILLTPIERGEIILLGATTENPISYLNRALRSRCQVLALAPLKSEEIQIALERAWSTEKPNEHQLPEVTRWLSYWAKGDLRAAIIGLEILLTLDSRDISVLKEVLSNSTNYDKVNVHYDLASALQKSIRGSDPNASLYYLSRMIHIDEDPQFIARRLLVCAAEDVGNADPQAFLLAEAASRAVEQIGWPEARIPLAQTVLYLANAPKSNAVITAIDAAMAAHDAPIPDSLIKSNYRPLTNGLSKTTEVYVHSRDDQSYAIDQKYLPSTLQATTFYKPIRPQERNWKDQSEPKLSQFEEHFTAWTAANPTGGEIPVNDWATKLGCSREAIARAVVRISGHNWNIERQLIAKPTSNKKVNQ